MTHTSLPSTLSSVFLELFNPLCDGIPIVCLARPRAVIFNSFFHTQIQLFAARSRLASFSFFLHFFTAIFFSSSENRFSTDTFHIDFFLLLLLLVFHSIRFAFSLSLHQLVLRKRSKCRIFFASTRETGWNFYSVQRISFSPLDHPFTLTFRSIVAIYF